MSARKKYAHTLTPNSPTGIEAKVRVREACLDWVKPARVLDAYCGREGRMFERVWARAESYLGIDREFVLTDPRRRIVSDTARALRSLDLRAFNVFDLDPFGDPWLGAYLIARRRRWEPNERGALALTDGNSFSARWGAIPSSLAGIAGVERKGMAPTIAGCEPLFRVAVRRWADLAGVRPVRLVFAKSRSSGSGSALMLYGALLFEGVSDAPASPPERTPRTPTRRPSRGSGG